ncbi:hypothetical protein UA08_07507 [Talaromyces atroroseus]|uniref:F-box domain-containing protein n=1 Tax=Talaromyces atroroseus TaxID=1441469 RepID=A0A225ARQ4_TALAT|nr:hypothetical protein UA08_07507 [Talaromyces atroroseus]OKL57125.1 hypothetical protein UA08_07507 [Talaromyces atroroseus]
MANDPAVFTPWFGPQQAVDYFRSLLAEGVSETQVLGTNRYLLDCVHSGGITPKIFAVWLFRAHPRFPSILRDALGDEDSSGVRHAGINVLKCAMKTDHWREKGWDAVGAIAQFSPAAFKKIRRRVSPSLPSAAEAFARYTSPAMLTSREPYESKVYQAGQASIPAIQFTLDLCDHACGESAEADDVHWGTRVRCIDMTLTIARRSKVPFDKILAFLEQVLPDLGHSERTLHDWEHLMHALVEFWVIAAFPDAHLESVSDAPAARRREELHPSRPSKAYKNSLEALLRTAFRTIPKTKLGPCVGVILPKTVAQARLSLLKIICKHLRGLDIDLNQPTPSKNEEQLLPWNSSFLMSLPGQDARWLFERALRLSSTKSLTTSMGLRWPVSGGHFPSFLENIVRVHLESTSKEEANARDSVTYQLIEDFKLKAVKARDPKDRLDWADLTISIAKLSKNVRTLKDAIYWTSRFLRDPFVRPLLVGRIYQADTASVLSCVVSPTLEDLAADVGIADSVIKYLMEQALLALQEPWYKSCQDREFGSLLQLVVCSRINAVKGLCRRGLGSENEIVGTLLDNVVPIMLQYESVGITEGYESLGWGCLSGPLENIGCPQKPNIGVLKLMDSLAQQRDRLWAQQRLLRNPQTANLSEGLPRGLPLQYLFPSKEWTMEVIKSQEVGSFVTKRVTELVFCDVGTVLQKISQEDYRLGPFVDSLEFAISIYIGNGPIEEQGARILEIWRHYSEKIPSSAGHTESFREYLCRLLRSRSLHKAARMIEPPQLPSLDIFQRMSRDSPCFGWEPRLENTHDSSRERWEETLLQHRFFATKQKGSLEALALLFSHPNAWKLPAKSKAFDIWRPKYGPLRLSCQHREALIASALLFLNSLAHNSERLLSGAFPEDTDVLRYPSVHLDYEFLSSIDDQGQATTAAIALLRGLVRVVPSSLLYRLSLSLLETLNELESASPKYALVQRCAFETMTLVRQSDKPELAAILGMKALELFPNASSWHRMAFPSSLAKALSRETAERVMHEFTAYVLTALRKQKEVRSTKSGLINTEKTGIKITTVKMLGTMLAENKFGVSPSFAVCALKDLFEACSHIDVRATVCSALLDILEEYDDADQAYEIFTSLASYAAGPSEINGSKSWLQSEQAKLPRVDSERPLLNLFTETAYHKIPAKYHEQYVHKTLIPLLEESTRQHNLWMRQFLSQLELTAEELSVTDFGPFVPDLIPRVMNMWSPYLPCEFLLKHRAWALAYLDCIKLRNINDKLTEQNRSWGITNAGYHWRSFFDSSAKTKYFRLLSSSLYDKTSPKVVNGITRESVAEEIVACAGIIIRNPFMFMNGHIQVSLGQFTNLLSVLEVTIPERRDEALPIVERIVADVRGLRTEEWNNNPQRSPPVLPSHLQLQTLLLPFPHLYKESSSRYARFTSSVLDLIEECTSSPTCIADRVLLRQAMKKMEKEDARQCALGFGREYESSPNPFVQYLRVWLAQGLVQEQKMVDDGCDTAIREMIFRWKYTGSLILIQYWEMRPFAEQTFGIYELAELIFLQLESPIDLIRAQRVCRTWRGIIQTSHAIQVACWYEPCGTRDTQTRPVSSRQAWRLNPCFNRIGVSISTEGWGEFNLTERIYDIPGSWATMQATQPPCQNMLIECYGDYSHDETLYYLIASMTGSLLMGDVMAVLAECQNRQGYGLDRWAGVEHYTGRLVQWFKDQWSPEDQMVVDIILDDVSTKVVVVSLPFASGEYPAFSLRRVNSSKRFLHEMILHKMVMNDGREYQWGHSKSPFLVNPVCKTGDYKANLLVVREHQEGYLSDYSHVFRLLSDVE